MSNVSDTFTADHSGGSFPHVAYPLLEGSENASPSRHPLESDAVEDAAMDEDEDYVEMDENGNVHVEPCPTGVNEWVFERPIFEKLGWPFLYVVEPTSPDLVCEMQSVNSSDPTTPQMCLKQFDTPGDLIDHFLLVHVPHIVFNPETYNLPPDEWQCPWGQCGERIHNFDDLLDHIRLHIPARILCVLCGDVWTKECDASKHLLPLNGEGDESQGENPATQRTMCSETIKEVPMRLVAMLVKYGFRDEAEAVSKYGRGMVAFFG